MKIAFIVHDFHCHGGHSRYVVELATRFMDKHEVHVYTNTWEGDFPKIYFHKIPAITWREITKVFSFILPATFLVPSNFDIIHSQGLCGFRHDITTTHIIQKTWLRELKSRGFVGSKSSYFFWKWIGIPLEKLALLPKFSKKIIAISKKVAYDLSIDYKITDNVEVVYHGVDLNTFHPRNKEYHRLEIRKAIGINDNIFLGIFVGNLKKGAVAAIKAISKTDSCHLLIVSGSDSTHEKKMVKHLGLERRIHWLGLSKEIEKIYAAADCLVFPTFFDTFGMVITEAMASGLPVITNRNAGASELIEHEVSGFLTTDPWDDIGISKYLNYLEKNRSIADQVGIKGRLAVESYDWDNCAKKTMDIYLKLSDEKRKMKNKAFK